MEGKGKFPKKFSYLPITYSHYMNIFCFNDEVLLMLFINA